MRTALFRRPSESSPMISREKTAMRMMLKTMLAGALVSLAAVTLSGAANAANLGACGSSGANLLSNFVTTTGPIFTSNGNTCTAGDKTFSNFTYFPQGDFAAGGANPVPPAAVGVASADPTTNCPTNSTCPGVVFLANWNAPALGGDTFVSFTVTAPTASITDAQLGVSGATGNPSQVVDSAMITAGSVTEERNLNFSNSFRAALTFAAPQTTLFVSNDMVVPAGFAATDIEKQFSQASNVPTPPGTTTLSDSEEPGSVIVFPKFIQGTVSLADGGTASLTPGAVDPITELELGIVCPKGVKCSEHQSVKLRLHWVCGTSEADLAGSFVCRETDFDLTATVFEKIVITPNGETAGFYTVAGGGLPTKFTPPANCPNGGGYLIAWVINPANDRPVKFDGLIGDAHLRPGSPAAAAPNPFAGSATALGSYKAIPIQADPGLDTFPATNSVITTNGNGALMFDGAPSHYTTLTGQIAGDIRYTNLTTGPTFTLGVLTLLTLDVKSNRPNNPVFVNLDFFGGNPSQIGNENQLSTFTEFICWEEIPITTINGALTTTFMGRKGVFVSDQAEKVQHAGISDASGPVTLLGLAEFLEGGFFPPTASWPRASFTGLFNSSVPVPTRFLPAPSSIFFP